MTNVLAPTIKRIFKVLLVLVLSIITLAVATTFYKFSKIEERLSDNNQSIDYSTLLKPNSPKNDTQTENGTSTIPLENPIANLITGNGSNYSIGTEKPKITIVEFADFSCPYCKESFSKIREITVKYNQDVKYIFRDLPIVNSYSPELALAARCAGEQGLFWIMHDRLFMDQGIKKKEEIFLSAKKSGVEMTEFTNCYNTQKYLPQIKKDYSDAQELQIEKLGTPIWFINGIRIEGEIPEATFDKIIESILAGK